MFDEDLEFTKKIWDKEWSISNQLDIKDKLVLYKYRYFIYPWLKDLPSNSKVCEIGCGNGQWLSFLNVIRPDIDYSGIDISDVGLKIIEKKGFNSIYFDISKTYEEYPLFDAVFSWGVIEHLPIPELALYNHFKMSKKFIAFDVPSKRSPATQWLEFRNRIKRLSLKKDWIINGMRYRPSELKVLLRRLLIWDKSWEVIHSGSNYSVLPNIHPFLKKVDLSLPDFIRSFYGHNYGYVLKKSHE